MERTEPMELVNGVEHGPGSRPGASRLSLELERDLVDRARSRPEAFVELYDFYLPRIYGFIYRRLGDANVTEDLTATVFERALDALRSGRFRNDAFGGWLYRVAANAVVDHVRAGRRTLRIVTDPDAAPAAGSAIPEPGDDAAAEALAAALDRIELTRAFERLSPKHRRVLALRFLDDLDPAEAGAVLGCSRRTFAVKLHRALTALRGELRREATDVA
jgi:RNA polymerase sigma-70 factor (ECF subfamily)